MTSYTTTDIYGGAITVDLPDCFADVSNLRQVPDHQEVYLDKNGFTSIIFDINERLGPAGSGPSVDGAALTAHLEDIVDSEDDQVQVWSSSSTQFSKLPEGTPAYTLITTQKSSLPKDSSPEFTAIVLTLIRLEKESTDILISINVPHIKGEYTDEVDMEVGKQGKLIENAIEYATRIWETFEIRDWDLFNEM
ncbi:putative ran guanine nucleotide release factor [Golovinomyces cichoracearum]|uniref:Putative ran guanine nucleotide release factor n=1 Tax=Golovinomyces cichoracearum TaxID=62708 RepID=A0A420I020_9PEZI|nr:putative ran guanine nucleotide release factor [Golovinomyces cichoracearum]